MKSARIRYTALLSFVALSLLFLPASQAAMSPDEDNNGADFTGPIISLPNTDGFIGQWVVIKTKVNVTKDTKINQDRGKVAVGVVVEVQGVKQTDGSINATEIDVKFVPPVGTPIKFSGKIEDLPST